MTNIASCLADKPLRINEVEDEKNKSKKYIFEGKDTLSADVYATALYKFLIKANTPVTVGVQGGWGSGKTSLISMVQDKLINDDEHNCISIYVNAWEHALFQQSDNKADVALSMLAGITEGIISKVQESIWIDKDIREKIVPTFVKRIWNNARSMSKGLGKFIFHATLFSTFGISPSDKNHSEDIETSISKNIIELRSNLAKMISSLRTADGKNIKAVIFVDDLDRIPPNTAVEILDIIKNIFDFENCIFVLAIDYDVVVKGLKEKFGDKSEKNEREYRQYFDKIIQIPFSMPIGAYSKHIDTMLKEGLSILGIKASEELMPRLATDIILATDGIPRSIKRIVNALSLLNYISEASNASIMTSDEEIEINFIVVALDVSFKEISNKLMENNHFTSWSFDTEGVRWGINKADFEDDLDALSTSNTDFDEQWEQVVYCLCAKSAQKGNAWLKHKSINISKLLNRIREVLGGSDLIPITEEKFNILNSALDKIKVISIDYGSNDNITTNQTKKRIDRKQDRITKFFQAIHSMTFDKYQCTQPDKKLYAVQKQETEDDYRRREYKFNNTFILDNDIDYECTIYLSWYNDSNRLEIHLEFGHEWRGKRKKSASDIFKNEFDDNFEFKMDSYTFWTYCEFEDIRYDDFMKTVLPDKYFPTLEKMISLTQNALNQIEGA